MTLRQKIELALTLLLLSALGALGCRPLSPAEQAKLDTFECEVAALAPSCEPVLDAAQLVRDLYVGKADLAHVVRILGLGRKEAEALVERLNACRPPEPPPVENLMPVRAPPPAYGNKIL
jgi:hypothetical protein